MYTIQLSIMLGIIPAVKIYCLSEYGHTWVKIVIAVFTIIFILFLACVMHIMYQRVREKTMNSLRRLFYTFISAFGVSWYVLSGALKAHTKTTRIKRINHCKSLSSPAKIT
jgi:hypothetical protein